MTVNDWYEAGDRIIRTVQTAVDTGDFSGLGRKISQAVDGKADTAQGRAFSLRLSQKVPGEFVSKAMKYLGFAAAACFGICCLFFVFAASSLRFFFMWDIANTFGVLLVISLLVGVFGVRRLQLRQRLLKYVGIVGTRAYCSLEELAAGIGKSDLFVRRDLEKMMRRGYFAECYLDREETVLITNRETYQQYLDAESSFEERRNTQQTEKEQEKQPERKEKVQKEEAQKEQPKEKARSPEHQKLIEDGEAYIRHIHECNDRIPGEEMTEKLNRLELVVSRIFAAAEKDPDSVTDLRKMMSYYLPTTQKLLDAYCDLENEPITGQNIRSTRKEIEAALDTINTAFENLLDSLYAEKAWDISSDISVLNTMLAQEGLTPDALRNGNQRSNTGGNA